MVRSWKWFWVWLVLTGVLGLLLQLLVGALGVYGWITAAVIAIALAPLVVRIEYKITGKEFPRSKWGAANTTPPSVL